MNINYQLTNSDFLEYQLYASSKSELHKKRRFRARIIGATIYLLVGLYLVNENGDVGIGILFAVLAILWFALFPMYSRWRYKRHFQNFVEENYKNRINKPVSIDFEGDFLNTKDGISESKIKGTELKELIETKGHFFIKLATDLSLIVPKQSIDNQMGFKKRVTDFGAKYVDELNWEWK